MRRHSARRLLVLPLALVLAACGDDPAGVPAATLDGRWPLQRVAASALPAAIFDGDFLDDASGTTHAVLLKANVGWLDLSHDGTRYVHHVDLSGWVDGQPSVVSDWNDHGTCTREGQTLHCVSDYLETVAFDAVVGDGAIAITQDLSGEQAPLAYAYVRAARD